MSLAIVGLAALLASLLVRQGLRADRGARLLLERQSAVIRQSNAFAALASDASLFDPGQTLPSRTLTETLAEVTRARRSSIWEFADGGRILSCKDNFDRETGGHVDGLELHHDELPALFTHLLAGEEIEVTDASRDRRTAELHQVLNAFGTKALLSVPVRRSDQVVGAVWLEDAPDTAPSRDFVRAVANMVALRMGDPSSAPPAHEHRAIAQPHPIHESVPRSLVADLRPAGIDPSTLHAEIYRDMAVMVLRFTDAAAMAVRLSRTPRCISDEIACGLQRIAADNGIPYLKLTGHEIVAAAGFEATDSAAATVIADMALAVRDHCIALFEESERTHEFQIGIDCSLALGGAPGANRESSIYGAMPCVSPGRWRLRRCRERCRPLRRRISGCARIFYFGRAAASTYRMWARREPLSWRRDCDRSAVDRARAGLRRFAVWMGSASARVDRTDCAHACEVCFISRLA